MTYDKFRDKYGDDLRLYETYGDDLALVKDADPDRVWTWVENPSGRGAGTVLKGYHTVNRIGYFLVPKA